MTTRNLKSKIFGFAIGALLAVSSAHADWGGDRCFDATQALNSAQAGLQQATLVLSQVQNICGGAVACILTAQNAFNQATVNVQQAQQRKDWACACQDAINRMSVAQNGFNQAVMVLAQAQNICGGAIACILTAQNAFNQAQVELNKAQVEKSRVCDGSGGGGWRRPAGPWGGGVGFGDNK